MLFALLAAASAGAAKLGLGYGLGIISWGPAATNATGGATTGATGTTSTVIAAMTAVTNGAWSSGLAWTTRVSATSVVVGAVIGDRLLGNGQGFARAVWCLVTALAAALGALIVIPLVGVPASRAHIGGNYAPHLLVGIYAAAGVVIGLLVALVAMAARAVAANVFVTAAWLWTVAIIASTDDAASGRPHGYAELGIWKFTDTGPIWHGYYIPGGLLLLGGALLVGGLAAFAAAARGDGRFGVAISGAAGPLLVTAAYLLARPDHGSAPPEQVSAFHVSPYMILAGLAGSVLVAAVGGGFGRHGKRAAKKADEQAAGQPGADADADADAEQWSTAGLPS
jgi:hypothetical protein